MTSATAGKCNPTDFTAGARLFGGNRMKLGVMAFNCSSGSAITTVDERWKLTWPDTVTIAQAVDAAGMEAILPVARWRGYGGTSNFNNATYESFTWASALGALTRYVSVLATVHVTLVHPVMAAKMAATIDHVTDGRFLMNVVCGWFKDELEMFGSQALRSHEDRYKYAAEWLAFVRRAWTEECEFDYDTDNFHARAVWSQPKPVQRPYPPVMNAGASAAAEDFTTRFCEMNFSVIKDRNSFEGARQQIARLKEMARSHGRDLKVWVHAYVVCRSSAKEAREYLNYYVRQKGDAEAADNLLRVFGMQVQSLDPKKLHEYREHFIAGHGGYPLVGTPTQIVDELTQLADIGVDGCLLSFVDYTREVAQWIKEVLPLTEQAGLRDPFTASQESAGLNSPGRRGLLDQREVLHESPT